MTSSCAISGIRASTAAAVSPLPSMSTRPRPAAMSAPVRLVSSVDLPTPVGPAIRECDSAPTTGWAMGRSAPGQVAVPSTRPVLRQALRWHQQRRGAEVETGQDRCVDRPGQQSGQLSGGVAIGEERGERGQGAISSAPVRKHRRWP